MPETAPQVFGAPLGFSVILPGLAMAGLLIVLMICVPWMRIRIIGVPVSVVQGTVVRIIITLLLGAWLVLNYVYAPVAYEVNQSDVVVRSRGGKLAIPLWTLEEVAVDHDRRFARAFGIFGCLIQQRRWNMTAQEVNGPFGVSQWCMIPAFGTTRVYVTDTQRAVILDGKTRVVVSPDDPEGFARAIESRLLSRRRKPNTL